MQIHSIGIDLATRRFTWCTGAAGKVLIKKKFTQKLLLAYTANLQTPLIWLGGLLGSALPRSGAAPKRGKDPLRLGSAHAVPDFPAPRRRTNVAHEVCTGQQGRNNSHNAVSTT